MITSPILANGTTVTLRRDSRYYYQCKGFEGIILRLHESKQDDDTWYRIKWDFGPEDNYPFEDIIVIAEDWDE